MVQAGADRNLGLLPDDQPCPSHPQTKQTIEPWQSHRRNPSSLYLSRLRTPHLECPDFGGGLGENAQD